MIMIMQTAYPVVWTAMVVTPEGATLRQNMREPDSAFQACSVTCVCVVCVHVCGGIIIMYRQQYSLSKNENIFHNDKTERGVRKKKKEHIFCIGRESNPDLLLGRQQC